MIGTLYWNDNKHFNIQTNDPVEELYRKLVNEMKQKYPQLHWGYLESCGVNACANCFGATREGRVIIELMTSTPGGYVQQFSHLLIGFLNDPNNYADFEKIRKDISPYAIQGNRVPQYYPFLVQRMFGIKGIFNFGIDINIFKNILNLQYPIQVCLKNPGHYIAIVAYDEINDVFIYHDSWPRNGKSGFCEQLPANILKNVLQDFYIYYMLR